MKGRSRGLMGSKRPVAASQLALCRSRLLLGSKRPRILAPTVLLHTQTAWLGPYICQLLRRLLPICQACLLLLLLMPLPLLQL